MGRIFRTEIALGAPAPETPDSIADLFHENTKIRRATVALTAGDAYGVREIDAMARAGKRYPGHPQIALPPNTIRDGPPIGTVIERRRTAGAFGAAPLALTDLAALLRWSYGVTGALATRGGGVQSLRAAPSAGALYPAELYLAVRNVQDLEPGLYHFEVATSSLARLRSGDHSAQLEAVCCGQRYARDAAVVILIAGVADRTRRKYGDRGYRYVLLDIGHVGQNLCLAGEALDLAVTTTCGFFDDEAADLLGLDGLDESVMYVAFIGPRAGA